MLEKGLEKIVKIWLIRHAKYYVELNNEDSKEKHDRAALTFVGTIYCGNNSNVINNYRFYHKLKKHYSRQS